MCCTIIVVVYGIKPKIKMTVSAIYLWVPYAQGLKLDSTVEWMDGQGINKF